MTEKRCRCWVDSSSKHVPADLVTGFSQVIPGLCRHLSWPDSSVCLASVIYIKVLLLLCCFHCVPFPLCVVYDCWTIHSSFPRGSNHISNIVSHSFHLFFPPTTMRLTAVLTFLCALVAFILSVLCLFAGSSRSFLQDADMLTVRWPTRL